MPVENNNPQYSGLVKYTSKRDGYALWLPLGWHSFEMGNGRHGIIFSPNSALPAPAFSIEKTVLPYSVTKEDLPILKEGFQKGLSNLSPVEIETQNEIIEDKIMALEARLTFLDQGQTKKRWIRIIYSGEAQLTMIAEGTSPEEFEYWLPMFYNIMMTMTL